ncbi:MAG: MBL fold metallo-hydrolase [Caulobacteraceae bacterium]|nr:MBL fold metallo-hydrolase [Caulobacteraceae bacterium]
MPSATLSAVSISSTLACRRTTSATWAQFYETPCATLMISRYAYRRTPGWENGAPRAAFITHLHYDHVLGVAMLDRATPVYIGPNDGAHRNFFYRFINQPTREALEGRTVRTWRFGSAPEGGLAALDVFGDGSLFALHVPGHTPGSTAYLVNSTQGPQLVTGDAVHSREG